MLFNKNTVIRAKSCWLVPYNIDHVEKYHEWMQNEELRVLTASEMLSLCDEYKMQKSWREDEDKLTFLIMNPTIIKSLFLKGLFCTCKTKSVIYQMAKLCFVTESEVYRTPSNTGVDNCQWCSKESDALIGDINLFIDESQVGEINMMIASSSHRRLGLGRAAISAFLFYTKERLDINKVIAKISESNTNSLNFFKAMGFTEEGRTEVFKEVTLFRVLSDFRDDTSTVEIHDF